MKTQQPLRSMIITGLIASSIPAMALDVTVVHYDAACGGNNGWAIAYVDTADGGIAPFTFFWDPAPPVGQGTDAVSGLGPGYHEVTVTDADGLSVTEGFTVDALPGLLAPNSTIAEVVSCFEPCAGQYFPWYGPLGGVAPYSGVSDPPGPVVSITGNQIVIHSMCAGQGYEITVSDSQGCSSVFQINDVAQVDPLELLGQSITASCPDGATGSVELLFSRPVQLLDSIVPGWNAVQLLEGLPPGPISIMVFGNILACNDTMTVQLEIPASNDQCGTISGTLFADLDGNCVQEGLEPGIPYRTLVLSPAPEDLVITDADGNYSRQRNFGQHLLNVTAPGFDPLCPGTLPILFELSMVEPVVIQDIAMAPLSGPDAYCYVTAMPPSPGFGKPCWITVHNNGPFTMEGLGMEFDFSTLQSVISSSIAPDQISPGQLTWTLPTLAPFSSWQTQLVLELENDPDLIGGTITYTASIVSPSPDADPQNDSHSIELPVLGAYDPNDKIATTTNSQSNVHYYFGVDEYIDYTIRFQNTGNAPAEHVYLLDTISDMHSLPSLQILGASHDFEVNWLEGPVLRFDFPQIMLPDSASDPIGSQGFVSFRLRHLENITFPGYTISNAADIFFDFNPPIRTNTTALIATIPTNIAGVETPTSMHVYPNPANDQLWVKGLSLQGMHWQVIGIDGKALLTGRVTSEEAVIGIAALAQGSYVLRFANSDGPVHQARFIKE